jgi:transposase
MCTKKLMVTCFTHGNEQEVREFGSTAKELLEPADWPNAGNCQMIAMESTESYWKHLCKILETSDLPAMVVNARHMKALFPSVWSFTSKLYLQIKPN